MRSSSPRLSTLAALLAFSAASSSSFADPFYWGQTTYSSGSTYNGNAATAGNWFTADVDGTNPADAPNSLAHDLFFNTTSANTTGGDVTVNANLAARSLTFNTSGNTRLVQSGSPIVTLGEGGITLGASSGNVTLGTGNFLNTRLTTTQGWTNNSANKLTVRSLSTNADSGAVTLTLNAAGTGGIDLSQNVSDNSVTNTLAIVIDSAGSGIVQMIGAANTYRGDTTIKRGALSAYGTLGSGAILLGDTTGSNAATLNVRLPSTTSSFANNITVRSGSSGTKTLTTNATNGVVLNGTLTLNDNVAFTASTDGTFNGVISGTGDFVKGGNGALTFAGANTFSGDLTINTGDFTLTEATGSLTFYIGADGDANQVNGSTTGAVAFNGTFNFDLTGASLIDGNSWTLVSIAGTAETYGAGFAIAGFTEKSAGVWTNGGFSYSENDGVLSYTAVPEPSTFALLGGLGSLLFASARRRNTRASASA